MSSWVLPIVVLACLWGAVQASNGSNDRIFVPNGPNPRAHSSHPGKHPGKRFPNPASTGVPAGWKPARTRSTNMTVTTPGAVVQNVRFTDGADLLVEANNVTVRRVEFRGGLISNNNGGCFPGLLLEDVSMVAPDHAGGNFQEGAISYGGYTARRVKITGRSEGFRVSGCGPVTIKDSFVKITPPEPCGDWHGDGIQGYYGDGLTVRNVTVDMSDHTTNNGGDCFGTSPFFYDGSSQNGNKGPVTVDRLMVEGMGFPFRLGVSGSVSGLKIVAGSWVYGPVDVNCPAVLPNWNAHIVKIASKYKVAKTVRSQRCTGTGD